MPKDGLRTALGVPPVDPETRAEAVAHPGAGWREYFYFEFLKVWIALGFLIVDSWIAVLFLQPFNGAGLSLSLAAALYLEFLAYRALWYRPGPEEDYRRDAFHATWLRPVQFGRWTPEAWRVRAGQPARDASEIAGPDPGEFL